MFVLRAVSLGVDRRTFGCRISARFMHPCCHTVTSVFYPRARLHLVVRHFHPRCTPREARWIQQLFQIRPYDIDQFFGGGSLRRILGAVWVQDMEPDMALDQFAH